MKRLSLLIALILLLVSEQPALAQPPDPPGKVYLVVVDKLSINDIDAKTTPALAELARKGAVGLVSNRTLGSSNTENGSLTIGAGNLARTFSPGIVAYNVDETVPGLSKSAGEIYQSTTGIDPGSAACVLVSLPALAAGMAKENTNTRLGSLGETLKEHGFKVCLLGNADNGYTADARSRPSTAIAMDGSGRVPLGNISSHTTIPSASFLGLETNYGFLQAEVSRYREAADVIVIELADLARLERAPAAFPYVFKAERIRLLNNIDNFVGELMTQITDNDLLLVISPSPAKQELESKNSFTPLLAYGSGYEGLLTSGSTRRDFVVANTDIAPTVLSFMGIEDYGIHMIGQPVIAKPAEGLDTLDTAQSLAASTALTNRLRSPLVKAYVVYQIIVIALVLLLLAVFKKTFQWLPPLVLVMGVVPLVLLPLGKISLPYEWAYGLLALLATLLLTWVLSLVFKPNYYKAFVLVSFATLLALNVDLLTGATMIKSSVLGYDPMAGARYYGVGNEYMGVMIGSSILVCAAAYQVWQRKWVLGLIGLFLASQAILISTPGLGANTDGALTAPAAFLVTLMFFSDIRVSLRNLLLVGSAIGFSVLGLVLFDLSRPPDLQSHVGRAANQVLTGGWQEALTIILRKASMNLKLIRYTIWSRVFLAVLAALVVLIYQPSGAMSRLKAECPRLFQGFSGILVGAVVGLIVNDSGIVAAATTSIYIIAPVLLLIFSQSEEPCQELIPVQDER
ncbi:MAG: hypothetical protein GXY92_02025 [Syntrophomonadaceae bacterium]|nr:hypothetical protein [Syntrophomonadaceae bacterium]